MTAKVLIVDENEDYRSFALNALSQSGYQPVSASSTAEAFEYLEHEPPDLVMLDISLPMTDGLKLVSSLSTRIPEGMPILYYTVLDEPDIPVAPALGSTSGIDDWLMRSNWPSSDLLLEPLDEGKLLRAVRNLLAHAEFQESAESLIQYASRLGIDVGDPKELIAVIEDGIPFSAFEKLQSELDISARELGELVQITRRTLNRRREKGKFRPDESDRILRISRIFDLGFQLFDENYDATRNWLKHPRSALGGPSPLVHAMTEVGALEVEDLVRRLEHGVFS